MERPSTFVSKNREWVREEKDPKNKKKKRLVLLQHRQPESSIVRTLLQIEKCRKSTFMKGQEGYTMQSILLLGEEKSDRNPMRLDWLVLKFF